jgi:ABC-type sugar transport system ATPase subunit
LSAVGRPVEIRAYADRIEVRQDGHVVGEHPRAFGRDQTVRVIRRHAFRVFEERLGQAILELN